jgi:hypothetical protein
MFSLILKRFIEAHMDTKIDYSFLPELEKLIKQVIEEYNNNNG